MSKITGNWKKRNFKIMPCICTRFHPKQCHIPQWEDKYTEKFHCEEFYAEHPDAEREGFYGMPVLGVYQARVRGKDGQWKYGQSFHYECPRCGRGGLGITDDYKNAWAALRGWNRMQESLYRFEEQWIID